MTGATNNVVAAITLEIIVLFMKLETIIAILATKLSLLNNT